jgi:hypothetical protein
MPKHMINMNQSMGGWKMTSPENECGNLSRYEKLYPFSSNRLKILTTKIQPSACPLLSSVKMPRYILRVADCGYLPKVPRSSHVHARYARARAHHTGYRFCSPSVMSVLEKMRGGRV